MRGSVRARGISRAQGEGSRERLLVRCRLNDFWSGVGVDLHLEPAGAEGRRAGLERALRDAVRDGRLAPGTLLPATRRLAAELGISRNTAKAAYDQLVAEGCLTARQGSGIQVASLPWADAAAVDVAARTRAPRLDLRPGSPDVGAFPAAAWLRALRRAIATAASPALGAATPGRACLRRVPPRHTPVSGAGTDG